MPTDNRVLPYGSWPSPITASDVVRADAAREWPGHFGGGVCWIQSGADETGRAALVWSGCDGEPLPGRHVKSRVIEYGGRPWAAVSGAFADGLLFVDGDDQRVHHWKPGAEPVPLTPIAGPGRQYRFADFEVRAGLVWSLREEVSDPRGREVARHIVTFPLDGTAADRPGAVVERAASHHFMTGPKLSPDGRRVAWIGWDHPDMPWDATSVLAADVPDDDASLDWQRIAGEHRESITQIDWAPDRPGTLYFAGDASGWWNIHEIDHNGRRRSLCPRPEEFADALWRIGQRWFVPLADGGIAVTHGVGPRRLGILRDGVIDDLDVPYTEWTGLAGDGGTVVAVGQSPRHRQTVLHVDPGESVARVIAAPVVSHEDHVSRPEPITCRDAEGSVVHAHLYRPHHPGVRGPDGELPPYIVVAHGGPTKRSPLAPSQEFGYFTSRGIGVVDVQYGGSTGFGRAYRDRLRGGWGVVDVADLITVAGSLASDGLADPGRIAVRGGSAGGWTAACALGRAPGVFAAGSIYYPVISPVLWRTEGTHDFESHYLDSLLGEWPAERDTYLERSPLRTAGSIRAPFLVCQGLRDLVCPPAQAEELLSKVDDVAPGYLTFASEGHGFGETSTVARCLAAELELFRSAFALTSAQDEIPIAGPGPRPGRPEHRMEHTIR